MASFLSDLTPEQQQMLYDQAGFFLVRDVPHGSIAGIDGSFHQTLAFSGYKLVPPSLHLLVISPPPDTSSPVPAPRTGSLYFSESKQIVSRSWSKSIESFAQAQGEEVISRDVLKTLDKELAPYPYELWPSWKPLFGGLTKEGIESVLGPGGEGLGSWDIDGFEVGEAEELTGGRDASSSLAAERVLRHRAEREGKGYDAEPPNGGEKASKWAQFDWRKSWREGAVGEEVSLFARDKSWLFWHVVDSQLSGDPLQVVTQLALALPLGILLQAPALLLNTYRRLLLLVSQSHLHLDPFAGGQYFPHASPDRTLLLANFHLSFVKLLHAQLNWLQQDFFSVELPESEGWFRGALMDDFQITIDAASSHAKHWDPATSQVWSEVHERWTALLALVSDKFGWEQDVKPVKKIKIGGWVEEDDEEEDEEDRPVFVDNQDHYLLDLS